MKKKNLPSHQPLPLDFWFSPPPSMLSVRRSPRIKAKEIALEHAKVAENSLIFDKVEKDYEDRRLVYEVEFVTNDGMEYDYEIDASSGTIVKYDFDAEYYAPSGTSRSRRQNGSSQAADASQISEDDAKRIALEQAGISEKQASYLHVKKRLGRRIRSL